MQSSPPVRAWEQGPSSPGGESQYSLDLAALELNSHSGSSTPLVKQYVDKVLSDDIDGPSDFTQNMEAWMKGGTVKKGTLRSGLGSIRERRDENQIAGSVHDDATSLTPRKESEEHTASHHTPSPSPPRESVFSHHKRDTAGAEDSSEWDPYVEATTLQPPAQNHFLQPTVEDYYSELPPVRGSSLSISRGSRDDSSPAKSEHSTPGRPSSDTISPVRSPVFQRSGPRQFSSQSEEATFVEQMQELRDRCQQLEHLNSALSKAIAEERSARKKESAEHEAILEDAARRERDLTDMKDQAHDHKEDFRREFAELKERSHRQDIDFQASKRDVERLRTNHAAEMQQLRQQMEREVAEHSQELNAVEQDLELAQQSRDNAVEDLKRMRKETDKRQDSHEDGAATDLRAEIPDLQPKLEELDKELRNQQTAHEAEIERSHQELQATRAELNTAIFERDDLQDTVSSLQAELEAARLRVADVEAVNEALDTRVSDAVRRREAYWRDRLTVADKERKVMAKALLRQWGREEIGVREPEQAYEYIFAGKNAGA